MGRFILSGGNDPRIASVFRRTPGIQFFALWSGADAQTTYTELSPNQAVASFVGNTAIDTAQSVIAPSSLEVNPEATTNRVNFPPLEKYQLSDKDFTIESYVRFSDVTGEKGFIGFSGRSVGEKSWGFYFNSVNGLTLEWHVATVRNTFIRAWVPVINTWYHVAVSRRGNDGFMFIDGIKQGATFDFTGVTMDDATGVFAKLTCGNHPWSRYIMTGHLDFQRLIVGHALYTENFTPPS